MIRPEAIEIVRAMIQDYVTLGKCKTAEALAVCLRDAREADKNEKRQKGEWVYEESMIMGSLRTTIRCPFCRTVDITFYGDKEDSKIKKMNSNFCNCCGADMRGEKE